MDEIDRAAAGAMAKIKENIKRFPDRSEAEYDRAAALRLAPEIRMLYGEGGNAVVTFTVNKDILSFAASREAFAPIAGGFSPDHIVYCKAEPLLVEAGENLPEKAEAAFAAYKAKYGYAPKIIFASGVGMFSCGKTKKEADTAAAVFADAMSIAVYSESFGGALPLDEELTRFIKNWEVESYRAKVALSGAAAKRLSEKISIVTGAAQGFGRGIAEAMLEEGAYVAIADMNYEGAKAFAAEACEKYGAGRAVAVCANVSDEQSVSDMIDACVFAYGGLDIFVNNAGIVRAGGLEEMTKANFELVTAVNYTAYFLCAKYASRPMKIQREYAPAYLSDIIEIKFQIGACGKQ